MAIALAAVGASIPTQAQTAWTMASGYPETSFFTQNARQFIKEIEDKSGGKLKIDLRSNDSLIKLDAIKRAVQSGQIQIGEIRLGVYDAAGYEGGQTVAGAAVGVNAATVSVTVEGLAPGDLVTVTVEEAGEYDLWGRVV
jgi:hypothetical protein